MFGEYLSLKSGVPNPPLPGPCDFRNQATEVAGECVCMCASRFALAAGEHLHASSICMSERRVCQPLTQMELHVLAHCAPRTIPSHLPVCKAEKIEELCLKLPNNVSSMVHQPFFRDFYYRVVVVFLNTHSCSRLFKSQRTWKKQQAYLFSSH